MKISRILYELLNSLRRRIMKTSLLVLFAVSSLLIISLGYNSDDDDAVFAQEEHVKYAASISETFVVMTDHVRYNVPYHITNGTMSNITSYCELSSLVIQVNSNGNGELILEIPRELLDKRGREGKEYNDFFVLLDGEEIDFEENKYDKTREIIIQLALDSKEFEIIGTIPYPEDGVDTCKVVHNPPYSYILPPLKQLERTADIHKIVCKDGQQLIFKRDVWSPACVNDDSIPKLIERDWAAEHDPAHVDMMGATDNKAIKDKWTAKYDQSEKTGHTATSQNTTLVQHGDNLFCNPSDDVTPEQCFSLEDIVFGNVTRDLPSSNKQEKTDAKTLSEINQLGLLYQKNGDTDKFDKQMKLMQEKQKEITSRYLGVSISEIYLKENWNFPFKKSSDVAIHNPELREPVCEIPENVPVHLQEIQQSEMFQIFAEKYSQHQLMIDISDERNHNGLIHYDLIAKSDDGLFSASTWFHLDSCTSEKTYSPHLLSCKDATNDNSTYTRIKSEIVSSLNNDDFCTIQLEPWHQDLRSFQAKISKEHDDNHSDMNDAIDSSDFATLNKFTTESRRLALITDIMRYYELEYTDYERMQKDLVKYNRMFGGIPKELQEIIDERK